MDSPSKPSSIRAQLVRFLLIGVLIVAVRFAYVVSVNGGSCSSSDFCFFSPSREGFTVSSAAASTGRAASFSVSGDVTSSNPAWRSREWRRSVDFYSSIFQDLIVEGFLAPSFKSLCVGTLEGQEVLALKEIGVSNAVGVSKKRSPPLVMAGDVLNLKFANNTFDFVFVGKSIDDSNRPVDLASEIVRVLKPEGFLVILTASAGDLYSIYSLQDLFPFCGKVRSREIEGLDSSKTLKEVVFQKEARVQEDSSSDGDGYGNGNGNSVDKCSVPEHKLQLVQSAEPLIEEEPLKPWLTLKRNIKNIKYLSSVADISFKRRYIYIDIGARSYGSSIGSWFKKQYPKQNHTFEIYAIEADKAFHAEYLTKKGIKLLPYAAWVRNESLSFEVNHDKDQKADERGGKGMGRIRPSGLPLDGKSTGDLHAIQGFDFAEWLKSTVTEKDFVVMKMDVEGTEFDLIPRLFETGAICLIDELFLECHYNRWQRCCPGERSPKYEYTYGQCLELFTSLRDNGVLVHQWW